MIKLYAPVSFTQYLFFSGQPETDNIRHTVLFQVNLRLLSLWSFMYEWKCRNCLAFILVWLNNWVTYCRKYQVDQLREGYGLLQDIRLPLHLSTHLTKWWGVFCVNTHIDLNVQVLILSDTSIGLWFMLRNFGLYPYIASYTTPLKIVITVLVALTPRSSFQECW